MSRDEDRIKHSKRLHKDEAAIAKQVKIAKTHGVPVENPHKFAKHHAMDCGVPNCPMCDHLTIQEKRNNQKSQDE